MAKKGYTPEQITNKLREAELQLQQGATVAAVSRAIGISSHTYYRWRKEYGGLRVDQAKKFKDLTAKNIGKKCAMVLNGKLLSAPVIRDTIPGGRAIINGIFTKSEAEDIAKGLMQH